MHIEINSGGSSLTLNRSASNQLSRQMAAILMELKVPANQRIQAVVEAKSPITAQERAAMISEYKARPHTQTLIDLLRNPEAKLVTLKFQNNVFHVITDIPLKPGHTLIVKPTTQHFVIPGTTVTTAEQAAPGTAKAANTAAGISGGERAASPTVLSNMSVLSAKTGLPQTATNEPGRNALTSTTQPNRLISLPASPNHQASAVLRPAIASDLPIAEPLSRQPLLVRLIQQGLPTMPQKVPLLHTIEQLRALPLLVSPGKPPATQDVLNGLLNSGTFYESRLKSALQGGVDASQLDTLKDHDAKSLLLQLQTGLNKLVAPAQTGQQQNLQDSVGKLLAQLFAPQQAQQAPSTSAAATTQSLLRAVEGALAQVQLNQTQSLVKHLADTPLPQTSLTFDIPLRLPDGIFNMFVALFEPKPKNKKDRSREPEQKRKQWKMLLGLDLGSVGELTTEITAEEDSVEATLWANKTSLREAAKKNLPDLAQQLAERGISVKHIHCSEEQPPIRETPKAGGPLVDLET